MSILFWLVMIYLAVTTVIALFRGPKVPSRVAIILAILMGIFPFVRSWMSDEGTSVFNPAGAIANLEWLLILLALGPVHLVCIYVILISKQKTISQSAASP